MEKIGFLWLSEVLLAVAFGRLLDDAIDLFSSILTNRPVSQLDVTYGFLGILAVIAITALTLILALYYLNLLKREQKETSLAVYTRDEIRLRDFLNKAKSSIHITGITLEETLRSNRGTMKEILQKSEIKEVRILMCNPESELVKMGQIDDLVGENTLDAIKSKITDNPHTLALCCISEQPFLNISTGLL